jgi:teichuronic acid biosynthesis glycosyltransferase TuaG
MNVSSEVKGQTDKVSIIIPFYNCKYIARAISSALNQTYKNIEVIVIDDGSTRNMERIKPYLTQIIYLKKGNGGTATALNMGIKQSTGDYIVWVSSDDELVNTKVEKQLSFMKKENVMISFTDYVWINDRNRIISSETLPKFPDKASLLEGLKKGCPINGSTIMIRRDLFSKLGFFDESLIYAHDYDFWIKAFLNVDIAYLDQSLTLYRVHQRMGSHRHRNKINEEVEIVKKRYRKVLGDF